MYTLMLSVTCCFFFFLSLDNSKSQCQAKLESQYPSLAQAVLSFWISLNRTGAAHVPQLVLYGMLRDGGWGREGE